ncbi:hypothetical protein RN001_007314 [Aquatica leii]|uniref:DUF4371 domain-containing protein n=1 Tax=Aquatica leii TaxID=1421715 RepID=A0AAN7QI85_9COLE|nr:hypothetical protein RN001_007314 [Aquatica leii]
MAVLKSKNFKTVYECPEKGVNIQIETEKLKIFKSNKERLIPLVKTIMLHRDDGELSDEIGQGKFRALLHFRMDAGDSNLQKHLETAPKNATYLSKTTQKQLIECCHTLIMKNVIKKVKEAKYYAVLADETTSTWIYTKEHNTRRVQMCFLSAIDLSGAALSEQILQELNRVSLQIENMRGQGYDGGANMSGKFNGVQDRLKEIQPLPVYMHCAAHKLDLAVVKACSLSSVHNVMGVTKFVRESAKRLELIKEAILEKLYNFSLRYQYERGASHHSNT